MARLYANENFPLPVVKKLRCLGHDVLTTQDAGKARQRVSDEEVLTFATCQKRAVVTLNRRHFIGLHKRRAEHAGIVVCKYNHDFKAQAQQIHANISSLEELDNRLIKI